MFFFHYWRRGHSPALMRCGNVHAAFILCANLVVFILVLQKCCEGKTKGLGIFPLYIRTAHVFFSLLATTGAASVPQMPSFSFGFYSKSQKNSRDLNEAKICNGKIIYFELYPHPEGKFDIDI